MSALSIQPTFPIFTGTDGLPLENGYIWIGEANLDPQGNPIAVYWDAALTIAAAQPIRTLAGYPSRSGTPARVYVNSDYSIRVQDKNASTVYSAPQAAERISSNLVTYQPPFTSGVATTVQDKLAQTVSVKDFGAVGDGVIDDTAAIQNAIDAAPALGQTIYFPVGTYKITASLSISNKKGIRLLGASKENSVISKAYSSGGPMVRFSTANYWAVDFLFFQGLNDTSGTDPLIYIEGSSFGRMTMCKVFNGRGPGIKIEQGAAVNGAYFNTLQDNHFFNNGSGQATDGSNIYCGSESSETKVIGGECQSSLGAGWRMDGGNNHTGLGASFEGNSTYGIRMKTAEVALFGCRFEGAGFMQYGVYIEDALSTVGAYGCQFAANVIGDIYPAAGSARISYMSNGNSTSPIAYRASGVSSWQPELDLGDGFFSVKDVSGVAEIRGNSTTRLTNTLNGVEIGSANGILSFNSPVLTLNWQAVPGLIWRAGSGSPEGVITAVVGSLYTRTNGGAGTTLYIKESGTGNTGWVAK